MATGRDPKLVFTSGQQQRLGLTRLVLAASCWQCCTSGLNTVRNAAMSRASSETSSCSRSGGDMWSVRIRYSADWKAGVWLGCHAHYGNLARMKMIWVMNHDDRQHCGQWLHQRLLAASDITLPATNCWLTGSAISMGAARSVTITWLARTGTTMGMR